MPEQINTFFVFSDANGAQCALSIISNLHIEHSAFRHVATWKPNCSPNVIQIDFKPLYYSELQEIFSLLCAVEVTKNYERIWPQ